MKRPLLTEEDKKAIAEAIERAEGTTSGEIVFAVTDASGRYRKATYQGALLGMVVGTAVYSALSVSHSIAVLLWVQLLSFVLSYAVLSYTPWRLWFVSARELEARVQEAALAEFYGSGLYKTRDSNGVLIFLSLLEHRVVVMGDAAIHAKLGTSHWDGVRDRIIEGIRQGKAREGIVEAVEICGKSLAAHFPRRSDDVNELSDRVIQRQVNPLSD